LENNEALKLIDKILNNLDKTGINSKLQNLLWFLCLTMSQ